MSLVGFSIIIGVFCGFLGYWKMSLIFPLITLAGHLYYKLWKFSPTTSITTKEENKKETFIPVDDEDYFIEQDERFSVTSLSNYPVYKDIFFSKKY